MGFLIIDNETSLHFLLIFYLYDNSILLHELNLSLHFVSRLQPQIFDGLLILGAEPLDLGFLVVLRCQALCRQASLYDNFFGAKSAEFVDCNSDDLSWVVDLFVVLSRVQVFHFDSVLDASVESDAHKPSFAHNSVDDSDVSG